MNFPHGGELVPDITAQVIPRLDPILLDKRPHREFRFPWLVSRARVQSNNVIWVWGN